MNQNKMKIIKTIIFGTIFSANTALSTTLTDALVSTYQNNPDLIAARENLKAVDEKMFQALSAFLPNIGYEWNFSQSKKDTKEDTLIDKTVVGQNVDPYQKINPWSTTKNTTGRLYLVQNLFNGGADLINLKYAKYTIESERAQLTQTEQQILYNGAEAYINVMQNARTLQINKENVAFYDRKLESVIHEIEAGVRKKSDLSEAEAARANAVANLAQANSDFETAKANFKKITGMEADNLSPPEELFKPIENKLDVEKFALKDNPKVKENFYLNKASELNTKKSVTAFLPKSDFQADMSKRKYRNNYANEEFPNAKNAPYSNTKSVNLKVSIPIYQQGIEYSNVRKSVAEASASRYSLKSAKDDALKLSTQALSQFLSNKEQVKSTSEAVKAGQAALDGISQGYDEGINSITDLLSAKEKLYDYEIRYESAKSQYELSKYNLAMVMGKLTAKDLSLPTKIYNPDQNYNKVRAELAGF